MQPGIYYGIPFEEYRAIKAINKSGLDYVAKSPAHYRASLDADQKTTPAMKLGSAIHCVVLEYHAFGDRYVVVPRDAPKKPTAAQLKAKKPSLKTRHNIHYWSEFSAHARGREVISCDTKDMCHLIRKNLFEKPAANEFFVEGKAEVTLVWDDDGILCKARADWLTEHGGAIVDLKSTQSAARDDFTKQVFNMNWHRQAAWYVDGYKKLTGRDLLFVFAAVEKEPPYASNYFYASDSTLELGRSENAAHLAKYRAAVNSKKWPSYEDGLTAIDPPAYRLKNKSPDELELF